MAKGHAAGRQGRREGFKGSFGRREAFKASLLPNVAFWNQKKISRKAPAGGQRTCCWAAKGAGKGLRAASGAGKPLRPAYCLTLLSETRRKSPGKRPAGGRREGFKGSLGRREAFKASLLPNVAFWNQKKISGKRPAGGQGHAAGPPSPRQVGAGKGLRAA